MKVIIIGLPYFSKKLRDSLAEYDPQNQYLSLDTNSKLSDKIKYFFHIINADLVYSLGGAVHGSKAMNLAFFLKKKVLMHWVGTDVQLARKDIVNGLVDRRYVDTASHFSEVEWIQKELQGLEIESETVHFATFDKKISENKEWPEQFSVLSYIGKGREEFYGINHLIELAAKHPYIDVNVVGISTYSKPIPTNLKLKGWVNNMEEEYKNCVVYLRLPEHDGLAFSVLEALSNGRHVGYSQQLDGCSYIPYFGELESFVLDCYRKFNRNMLELNREGVEYVKNNFNQIKVLSGLVDRFKSFNKGRIFT